MKIIVLGKNGQVGTELVNQLKARKQDFLAFDRTSLDVSQINEIKPFILKHQPDILINCTAYTAVDQAETETGQAFAINRDAPAAMASACVHLDIPFFHLSTDYVFSGDASSPYSEDDKTNPINIYGQSKWEGEEAIRKLCQTHLIIRTSWVFGHHGHNFVKTILKLGSEREELSIVDDQRGCPTSAQDISRMLLNLAGQVRQNPSSQKWGTYHFCGQPPVSWCEFSKVIVEEARRWMPMKTQVIHPIKTQDYPRPAKRPQYSILNTDNIKKDFDIDSPDWRKALKEVIEEYSKVIAK